MANQYQQQLDNIMKHQVSRSEFIKYIGVAALGIVGVTSFLRNLHESVRPSTSRPAQQLSDYGMSNYGL